MLAARLCQVSLAPALRASFIRPTSLLKSQTPQRLSLKNFADGPGRYGSTVRGTTKRTLKERMMAPAQGTAFTIGQGAVAGGAVLGLGSLIYYGVRTSKETNVMQQMLLWPQHVRDRIHSTYLYVAGSLGITAASAIAVFRTPALLNLFAVNSLVGGLVLMGCLIVSSQVLHAVPYSEGFGTKQLLWMGHSALVGAVIAPLCILGGPLMVRAALYTAGIVGGLTSIALFAPSEKFLQMGGPLAIGFGLVLAASLGTHVLPPHTVAGSGLFSIALYGGLLLFSMLTLFETQAIVKRAETYPVMSNKPYDPVNASVGLYMTIINIFIRMVTMLGMGGQRKK